MVISQREVLRGERVCIRARTCVCVGGGVQVLTAPEPREVLTRSLSH